MKKKTLLPLLGYTLLTILMTWPTAAQLASAIPGDGFDGWQNYWNQWWIKEALLNKQTHFFFTDVLYPPTGVSLLFHTLNFFNGLWTLPVQLNFGLTVAYNAVVFFHFILSGFGVYLLARYTLAQLGFSGDNAAWASFGAGIVFTFSPFHLAHLLGHMQVLSLTWPPFYILWVFRTLNTWRKSLKTDPAASFSRKDLALCGLFLALTTMIDWYQTLYMFLFTALALAWALWRVRRDTKIGVATLFKPIIALALMGLGFGLIFSPLIVPMAAEAATADYMKPSFQENVVLSADLLAFFTPSELHPVWGEWFLPYYQNYTTTTSERLIFAGFVPLILAGFAAIRYRKRCAVQFWSLFSATFFVLALGPYLHIAGNIVKVGETPLPMPYLFLYKVIPFIGISRSLSRFDLMVMIGLGVLTAVGLARLKLRAQLPLLVLICFEFAAFPYLMSPVDTPEFFKTIAAEPDDYAIAALPMNWDRPSPLLYQTVHRKGLLTAYTSRDNPLDLSRRTPVFQQWRALSDDIIKVDLAAVAPTILNDFNLKYVVLDYYQMPPGSERERTEAWVSAALPNIAPVHRDERITAYQSPPVSEPQPYLQLGDGWGELLVSDTVARMMEAESSILLNHIDSAGFQLQIEAQTGQAFTGLQARSNDQSLSIALSADGATATVELPAGAKSVSLALPQVTSVVALRLQYSP